MLRVLIQDQRGSIDPDKAQPCRGFSSCLLVEGHTPWKYGSVWHKAWDDSAARAWRTTPEQHRRAPSPWGGLAQCVTKQRRMYRKRGARWLWGTAAPGS